MMRGEVRYIQCFANQHQPCAFNLAIYKTGNLVKSGGKNLLFRPAYPIQNCTGAICSVMGISLSTSSPSAWIDRWIARVAPVLANASSVSASGIEEARPEVRVSTTDCTMEGTVSSTPSAAALAAKLGTPGVTSGNIQLFQPVNLFSQCRPYRHVARM